MSHSLRIGTPAFTPERRSQLSRLLRESVHLAESELLQAMGAVLDGRDAEAFLLGEESIVRIFGLAASHVAAGLLGLIHNDGAWVTDALTSARANSPRPTRSLGLRSTPVQFLGGARLTLTVPYVIEELRARPGRGRGVGRRRVSGSGSYPTLEALGISSRATPALQSEDARQTVRCASFADAREALGERGVELDEKTVRSLTLSVGSKALARREARIDAAGQGLVLSDEYVGKRIVISADGGRIRLREGGRRGRKGKNGRRRYRTPWREPKLFSVYVIDEKGNKVKKIPMLYDATLGDADAMFEILAAELLLRGAARAEEIVVVADGAPWIWNRVDALADVLGVERKQIVRVADFYHAVEHLTAFAELCSGWNEEKCRRWIRKMRRRLKNGKIKEVIKIMRTLCAGRNKAKIRTEIEYFETRKTYMRYHAFQWRKIPIGSGAVESAIRRVINLRLKGPSIFWRKENAERMLHLRAYLKAGRWNELMRSVIQPAHIAPTRCKGAA